MAPTTPTGEPTSLVAGDSWRWRIYDDAVYLQSEGWSLVYEFVGKDLPLKIEPVFQTSGDDENHWLVSETTTATALVSGRYELRKRWVGSGSFAGREESIGRDGTLNGPPFRVTLAQDPRTAAAGDFQTHAERTLAVIELALEGRLTTDLESYQIAGRAISKIPIETLMKMRGRYAGLVTQERTGRVGRRHLVRFASA